VSRPALVPVKLAAVVRAHRGVACCEW
jgi:hypothetical protein